MRHRLLLSIIDLCLIGLATLAAQLLRDSFETRPEQLLALLPYLGLTLAVTTPVLAGLGLNQSIWRLSSMPDYLRILAATVLIVTSAVVLGFLINRLDGVARSLPIIQGFLILFGLVGARVASRLRHAGRGRMPAVPLGAPRPSASENILVVGVNQIAELYLRSVAEFAAGRVRVAGLLSPKDRHTGRVIQGHTVLGPAEEVASVLRDLEVHGVLVDRIVVALPFDTLSPSAREALLEIEKSSTIRLEFFAENIGLVGRSGHEATDFRAPAPIKDDDVALFDASAVEALARRRYWRVKRVLDVVGATCAIVILAPIVVLVALLVVIDNGLPMIFWQLRPGAGGRPFRLYKFRTMAAPHGADGRRIPDAERSTLIGRILRRWRLDELPQLFNILIGDMSFVGPRPLLPIDQFPALAARLAVRPGLTGWAQIKGGRGLTASDKAALDVWYIKNGSFRVDLAILAGTVRMLVLGERTDRAAIRQAWRELGCERLDYGRLPHPKRLDHAQVLPSSGTMGGYEEANRAMQRRGPKINGRLRDSA